jgi:hypothetical protein
MPGSDSLDPKPADDPALTGPQTALAPVAPGPLPSQSAAVDGPLNPATAQPIDLPDGVARRRTGRAFPPRGALRHRADGIRRAYHAAWRQYEAWCRSPPIRPTIAMHVVSLADAGLAVSSIRAPLPLELTRFGGRFVT